MFPNMLRCFSSVGLARFPLRIVLLSKSHKVSIKTVRNGLLYTIIRRFQSSGSNKDAPPPPPNDDGKNNRFPKTLAWFVGMWIAADITIYVLRKVGIIKSQSAEESFMKALAQPVTWKVFVQEMLATGEVDRITVSPELNAVYVQLHKGALLKDNDPLQVRPDAYRVYRLDVHSVETFERNLRQAEKELGVPAHDSVLVQYSRPQYGERIVLGALFAVSLAVVLYMRGRNGGLQQKSGSMFTGMFDSVRKANYKVVDSNFQVNENLKVKFSDVVGLTEAKMEIQEFVEYLKVPEKFTRLGAKLPKGALLLGPPGCGKTLLAKAVASEAHVPFLATNGAEFVEMIGGLGAARVRDLFKEAKRRAPCMIYIDEIDAVGRKRSGTGSSGGGNSEMEQTLNQLLVEMDGMDSTAGVMVIASTNRADVLDKALLRRGRFDRHIDIDLPTLLERVDIFGYYLSKIKLEQPASHFATRLAKLTPGFTGADINNVCNESAIKAASEKANLVKEKHIFAALDRVLTGPEKRSNTISPEEKNIVAYHESGHALVGWLMEHTNVLLKVTIVPRTSSALGFAQYNPQDKKLYSEDELFDRMCMTLGGRAAENLIFASPTSGAQNDLEKVTRLAYDQVKKYGMSRALGPLSFSASGSDQLNQFYFDKPYSHHLDALIDKEANDIVRRAYKKTETTLKENRHLLDKLANALLKHETLTYDDVVKLIGPPKFVANKKKTESIDLELPSPIEEPQRETQPANNDEQDKDDDDSDESDNKKQFRKTRLNFL